MATCPGFLSQTFKQAQLAYHTPNVAQCIQITVLEKTQRRFHLTNLCCLQTCIKNAIFVQHKQETVRRHEVSATLLQHFKQNKAVSNIYQFQFSENAILPLLAKFSKLSWLILLIKAESIKEAPTSASTLSRQLFCIYSSCMQFLFGHKHAVFIHFVFLYSQFRFYTRTLGHHLSKDQHNTLLSFCIDFLPALQVYCRV